MNKALFYHLSPRQLTVIRTHNILLVIIIIACVRPINYVFDVFSIPVPIGSLATGAPYLVVLCLIIYMVNFQLLSRFSKPVFDPSFLYMGLILAVWTTLECLHGFISGDLSRNLLQSIFWFALFHHMIRSHLRVSAYQNIDQTELLKKASLYIILTMAVIHLLLHNLSAYEMFGDYISKDQLYGRNSLSYLSLLGVFLILFCPLDKDSFFEQKLSLLALGIFSLIPLINKTRSAIIIFFVLISIKCFSLLWKYNKRLFYCTIIITISITGIFFPKEKIKVFTFGLNPEVNFSYEEITKLSGPKASIYIRNRTNLIVFRAFLQNPILGTGMAKVKKKLKVGGWWCHTFYLLPLTSYGLIGFIPFFFFFLFEVHQSWKRYFWTTLAFCALLLGTWTFTNDLYIWLTIPLNIFWSDHEINSFLLT